MPREKVLAGGIKSLTDAELIALLFGTGVQGKPVLELCAEILADNDNHLAAVTRLSVKELCQRYKGIGTAKAITLLAALELGARSAADALATEHPQVLSSDIAYNLMAHHFLSLTHEEFWVLYLNRGGRTIRSCRISQGGTAATVVDVKIIMHLALEITASSMILFHNHPSGTKKPSVEDDRLTQRIKDAAALFDIRVNDHIIVTDAGYYSYADNGKI